MCNDDASNLRSTYDTFSAQLQRRVFVVSEHVRCCETRFSYWYRFQSRWDSLCTRVFQAPTCS